MDNQVTINLESDPRSKDIIEQLSELVPEANTQHIFRAALRHFSEVAAKYEQEVYIREQVDFDTEPEKD